MRVALLGPIAWRTPPRHYGPWEQVTEPVGRGPGRQGVEVTLFATLDSQTAAVLDGVCRAGYAEEPSSGWPGLGGDARRVRAGPVRGVRSGAQSSRLAAVGASPRIAGPRCSPPSTGSPARRSCRPTERPRRRTCRSPTRTGRPELDYARHRLSWHRPERGRRSTRSAATSWWSSAGSIRTRAPPTAIEIARRGRAAADHRRADS